MIRSDNINRVGIFCFYDPYGKADRYIDFYLADFSKNLSRLIIVVNGELSDESRELFLKYSGDLIVRKNEGYDAWAVKTAIERIGWKELGLLDELVISNSTFFGPLFPLAEMFQGMADRDVDFWGITRHYGTEIDFLKTNPYGCIPEHIQSYFMVYRNSILKSKVFQDYWKTLPAIHSYSEAIGLYETYITRYFSEAGFKWDTWTGKNIFREYTDEPLKTFPVELMRDEKCPIVKRRAFFSERKDILEYLAVPTGKAIIDYLKDETDYDTDMIYENIIRTCHMTDIVSNLNLIHILSSEKSTENRKISPEKTVLVMHLYYADMAGHYLSFARNMPEGSSIFITTSSDKIRQLTEEQIKKDPDHHYEIIPTENRGRDISAMWVAARKKTYGFDLICFVHDKKSGQNKPGSVGISWGERNLCNLLKTKELINNIISLFDSQKYLGLLVTMPPIHGKYAEHYDHPWGTNYKITRKFLEKLDVNVPIDESKNPITAFGSCYWYRKAALEKLFSHDFHYEDFPEEPLAEDGTVSHAVERSLPFVAQSAGYYSGIAIEKEEAENEILTLDYFLRKGITVKMPDYTLYLEKEMRKYYKQTSLKWQLKHRVKKIFHIREEEE